MKNAGTDQEFTGNLGMPSHEWLIRVAERTGAEEILAILSISPIAEIRMAVADNRSTPEHVLTLLAQDPDVDVRYSMAENHNLSEELLQTLVDDPNPYVAMRAQKTMNRIHCGAVYRADFGSGELKMRRTNRSSG